LLILVVECIFVPAFAVFSHIVYPYIGYLLIAVKQICKIQKRFVVIATFVFWLENSIEDILDFFPSYLQFNSDRLFFI